MSKSKYCKGIQCPKILWLDEHHPELAEDIIPENVMETGTRVGELARSYFGDYELVAFDFQKNKMVAQTAELMTEAGNIAEASFLYDYLFCAVDILHRNGDDWDIVEVKSSTQVSDIYIEDMAFQFYVLEKCGIPVKRVYNLHIDNTYVRNGELELKKLFALEDYTDLVIRKFYEIQEQDRIERIREYLKAKAEPEHSVFDLARMQTKKKYELYHAGIISYEDVLKHPDQINEKQKRQAESILYQQPDTYDVPQIRSFLSTLSYPLYHLDFETFQQAIPEFDGCRPYEQIPFQYSLHIEYEDGKLEHLEFLAKEGQDPRRALAEHLMNIHDNIHDLMIPFQKQYYYSAAMQGSYSIKYVLPALWPGDPELNYHNLEGVHNGSEASASFADMTNHTPEEIAVMRENLLKYCGLDTYAMVKVLRKLKEIVT